MRYLSVCSGIEAASVAWYPIGFEPVGFSEIEKFPAAVLSTRFPQVKNFGDMNGYESWDLEAIDILVGGTPCQSFSVAGLRGGMEDPRGNLALVYCRILERFRPKWFVWENVPGVLSSKRGRDFGSFLGAVAKLGYGFAYRVLDAQWFGVPQRRRRVFVVGCIGNWRRAAAVLFERESLLRNIAKGKGQKQSVAKTLRGRANSSHREDAGGQVAVAFQCQGSNVGRMGTLRAGNGNETGGVPFIPVAIGSRARGDDGRVYSRPEHVGPIAGTVDAIKPERVLTAQMQVRRLTPRECERLQGFPDDWTAIEFRGKPDCDGPRYKAIGNSMAVPVMRWIGERLALSSNGT